MIGLKFYSYNVYHPVAMYLSQEYTGLPLCVWVKEAGKIETVPAFGFTLKPCHKNSVSPSPSGMSFKYIVQAKTLLADSRSSVSQCQTWYPPLGGVFCNLTCNEVAFICFTIQNSSAYNAIHLFKTSLTFKTIKLSAFITYLIFRT